jgi:hypothetical protein
MWSAYVSDQADIDRRPARPSRGVAMTHAVARFSLAARAALALYGAPAVAQVHVHAPAMQVYSGELFDNRLTVTPVTSGASGLNDNVALDARYSYTVANLWGVQYSGGYSLIQAAAVVRGVGNLGDIAVDVDRAWSATLKYQAVASWSYNAGRRNDVAPARQTFDSHSAARRNVDPPEDSALWPAKHQEERQEASFTAEAVLPEPRSESRVSRAGIGSLFWAVRNPVQGWRVILPIQPDRGSDPPSEVKTWCRAFASAPTGRAAWP